MDYPTFLARGLPIASGVIEGACRHLIQDRLGITGARWDLPGAEAMLRLRALRTSGDWDAYWRFINARRHSATTRPLRLLPDGHARKEPHPGTTSTNGSRCTT